MEKIFKKIILFVAIGVLFVAISGAEAANAASLYFSPSAGSFNKGENFTVGVYVDAETSINAVQGSVIFPTEYLEIIKIESNNNSIIDLWVQKPSFSNTGNFGNIRFEGVALNPGFIGSKGKIISVIFRARKEGAANLSFSEFSVLANDGFGTSLAASGGKAGFTFLYSEPSLNKKEVSEKDIKAIEDKVKAVEQQVKMIVSPAEGPDSVIAAWEKLPSWLRIGILIFVGIASFILLFIILSLAIVILIWTWSFYGRHHKEFTGKISIFMERLTGRLKRATVSAEKEFEGDVRYTIRELKHEFKEARDDDSIGEVWKDYWFSVIKIVKRFFTKNRHQ